MRIIVPLSFLGILVILCWAFQRLRYAILIIANIPFAFIGSIALLYLTHTHLSVSAMIGFIALCGVSVQNGIVLVGNSTCFDTAVCRCARRSTKAPNSAFAPF